jgi:excisionase family DNA binding protein
MGKKLPVPGKYEGKIRTLAEAAEYLHMGISTLYEKEKKGIIPSFRPQHGKLLFNIDILDAWLEGKDVKEGL